MNIFSYLEKELNEMSKTYKKSKIPYYKFYNKIKSLLKDGGFKIKKSIFNKEWVDIITIAENNSVIVQCRSTKHKNMIYRTLQSSIKEYSRKVKKERAKVAILALENYGIPDKYYENKEKTLEKNKVIIWDNKEIEYFKALVSALGKWARFPLLGDLGCKEEFASPLYVPFTKVNQNGTEFVVFTISPENLLKIADVFRRIRDPKAYQRMVKKKRVKGELKEFLEGKLIPRPTFPTNLVCVFKNGARFDDKKEKMIIPMKYSSVWIVDGQHRLYAFCHVFNTKMREKFDLICAGFNVLGIDNSFLELQDQADMFATVNQTAKKVQKELLIDILLKTGRASRTMKVVDKLRKKEVFENRIKTIDSPGKIHIATFVDTAPMRRLVGDEKTTGILSKWYGRRCVPKIIPANEEEKFIDHCVRILERYFVLIQNVFSKEWRNPRKYILATDRSIRALLRMAEDVLNYSDRLRKRKKVKEVLNALKSWDFRNEKLKRMYLGEAGADELLDVWTGKIQDSYPDFGPQPKMREVKIDPRKGNLAKNIIKEKLSKFEDVVIGELMHIDRTTFVNYIAIIPVYCTIRLFFHRVKNWDRCIREIDNLPQKSVEVREIRCSDDKRFIHERWLANGKHKIDFGIDLKDDAIGSGGYTITLSDKPRITQRYRRFQENWDAGDKLKEKFDAKITRSHKKR